MTIREVLASIDLLDSQFYQDNSIHLDTWLAPKDVLTVSQFIAEQTHSSEGIVIYGAGTHTVMLLENLPVGTLKKVCCILDRRPQGRAFSVPVIHPEQLLSSNIDYDQLVLSHYDFEGSMRNTLLDIGIEEEKILPVYTNPAYQEYALANCELPDFASIDGQEKPIIAFVSLRPTRKMFDEAGLRQLRKHVDVVAVNLDMGRELTTDPQAYDVSYDCKRSLILMCGAIKILQPDIIYVHDQIETYYLFTPLLKSCFPGIKVIWEPYDILRLMIDDYSVLSKDKELSKSEIDFIKSNEDASLKKADGLVYKELGTLPTKLMQEIRNGFALQYNRYLSRECFTSVDKKYSAPFRLVYAGSLDTSGRADIFTGDNYLVDQFDIMLRQGLCLDLYINCSASELKSLYLDYHPLLQRYSDFNMVPRVDTPELIRILAKTYHYGIQIGRCNNEMLRVNRRRYQCTFSAKLWPYFFAGLPVIVNQELEGMADLVREYGVGLIVSCHDYSQLGNVIAKVSPEQYADMKANVADLTRAYCVESRTPVFWGYLQQVINKNGYSRIDE